MRELLTAAQMRAAERAAIEAGEVTGLELMERAGRGVVEAMLDWRPALATAPQRAVVLCGPGNNGGDGFVVARLLKERGWAVEVFLYGRDPADLDRLPPDAAENARRWAALGEIRPLAELRITERSCDVVIDALFGTGLTRPLEGLSRLTRELAAARRGPRCPLVVCVDMPSGRCSDSGRMLHARASPDPEDCILPDLTVTFHRPRVGHFLEAGWTQGSRLAIRDIGLDRDPDVEDARRVRLAGPPGRLGKMLGHKYHYGHALVLSGGSGKGGAARMAARGALRIGAGLVTVGCPPAALQENAAALDAIMLAPFADAEQLAEFLPKRKVNAVCIGPGFGRGERLRGFLAAVLGPVEPCRPGERGRGADATRPGVVLDADALSDFAGAPETLFGMLHDRCVLTPHQGEFGRLFPDILERLKAPAARGPAYSKVDATRDAAARAGCVVLFKGPDTVIAEPSGRCVISAGLYERAAPWLATAGTGDVLAGFIAGLLARGLRAFEAAEAAAWLQVECALQFGPGLIAEDLPEQLPAVLRRLGV